MKIIGTLTVRIEMEATEEALADRECGHNVIQELDYNFESHTEGVKITDTEIIEYVLDEGAESDELDEIEDSRFYPV